MKLFPSEKMTVDLGLQQEGIVRGVNQTHMAPAVSFLTQGKWASPGGLTEVPRGSSDNISKLCETWQLKLLQKEGRKRRSEGQVGDTISDILEGRQHRKGSWTERWVLVPNWNHPDYVG